MRKIYILIHDYRDFSPWTPGSIAKDTRKGKTMFVEGMHGRS